MLIHVHKYGIITINLFMQGVVKIIETPEIALIIINISFNFTLINLKFYYVNVLPSLHSLEV